MVKTACPNDNVHSKQLCAFYLLYTRNPDLSSLIFNFFEKVQKFVNHVHITFLYTGNKKTLVIPVFIDMISV